MVSAPTIRVSVVELMVVLVIGAVGGAVLADRVEPKAAFTPPDLTTVCPSGVRIQRNPDGEVERVVVTYEVEDAK